MCKLKIELLIITLLTIFLPKVKAQENPNTLENIQSTDSSILLREATVQAYQVNGKLHTIPGNLSTLNELDLNLSDGTNLASILNTLPGVSMQSGTYTTNRIVIRGMGSRTPYNTNRIRSYLNDIPITSSDGVSTPEEIDLQSLGRIEVIKGPSSALFGSGLGGSINLYTPSKFLSDGNLSLQYGSFNTVKFNLSGTVNNGNANLWNSLSHLQSDGYRENNHYKRSTLLSTAEWKKTRWAINYTLLLIDLNAGIPSSLGKTQYENNPGAAAANWKAIEGYKKSRKGLAGITLKNKLSERFTNSFTLFGKLNDSYEKRPFNNLDDRSLGAGFRNKISLHNPKTDWVLGTEWIAEQYGWNLDIKDSVINKNKENRRQLNVFAVANYKPVPKLTISIAGAVNFINYRLMDLYSINGDQSGKREFPLIFSPRIGTNYAPNNLFAIYASAGHGFSMPSPEETLLPVGDVNPDIEPEQGMQYEIGTRANLFAKKLQLDVSLYWIELNNLLVTKRISEDVFTGINAGKTRHQGFEIQLQNNLFEQNSFPGKLTSNLNYSTSLNKFIDFIDAGNTYDGNHLPGIPNQTLNVQFIWKPFKILEVYTSTQYTGCQYLDDKNTLKNPAYFLTNIKVSTHFKIKKTSVFNLFAGINNLSNTKYASMVIINAIAFGNAEPRYYYPGLPRHGFVGLEFCF